MVSTDNMSNLNYLYCNLNFNQNILNQDIAITFGEDSLIQQYSPYFNTLTREMEVLLMSGDLIDGRYVRRGQTDQEMIIELVLATIGVAVPFISLAEKLGAHLPHLLETGLHLVERVGEAGHTAAHVHHEQRRETTPEIEGNTVNAFIHRLAGELTYNFRHELLICSSYKCKVLARLHFRQIKECLKLQVETGGRPLNANELIVGKINPDPVEQIMLRIMEYIFNREGRIFRSSSTERENFLLDFHASIQNPQENLEQIIYNLSHFVFFKDDWYLWKRHNIGKSLFQQNPQLSNNNFLLQGLNLYHHVPTTHFPIQAVTTFNKAFLTALFYNHIPMNNIARDILLLTMRLHVVRTIERDTPQTTHIHDITCKVMVYLAHPELKEVYRRLETMETTVNNLTTRLTQLETQL